LIALTICTTAAFVLFLVFESLRWRYLAASLPIAAAPWAVRRAFRVSLIVTDDRVVVKNYWWTHTFPWSEVEGVGIALKQQGVLPQPALAFKLRNGEPVFASGASWFQNPVGCGLAAGADHQTVGGGAFAPGLSGTGYPDSVYYCAQAIATAQCSLSINGGVSFNPAVPIYTALQCGGLHGHIKAAPDGTVYVPNADCGGKAAVVVSTDNGTTWNVRSVPGSTTQDESDPSVGVGSSGTVYLGWQNGNGHPYVAVSHDRGATWTNAQDVGTGFNLQNVQFPAVVAGDDDRAAYAFLGTPTSGDDQKSTFAGAWHLYVATTFDGGVTWTRVDVTPSDPVQRGCIWMAGGSNKCRNLLDFMDATVDKTGHVLVGYADGCIGTCVTSGPNSYSAVATIARQTGGTGLFAAFGG